MRNKLLRSLSLCLLLAMLAGAMLPVCAEAKPSIKKETLWLGHAKDSVVLENWPDEAKVVSITSSKPSVLKVKKDKSFPPFGLWMEPLSVGTSKVTVKYKLNGKTYTMKQDITVKDYPNPAPFTWIKLNDKKISLTKNKYVYTKKKYTKKNATIAFKLNKNWKLDGCFGAGWIDDEMVDAINWKNGEKFKVPAKFTRAVLAIELTNKKTKDTFYYEVHLNR